MTASHDTCHPVTPLQKLRALPPHVRAPALEVLDQLTAPMGPRQLDRAFQDAGFTRTEARRFTLALKHLSVIAITPR